MKHILFFLFFLSPLLTRAQSQPLEFFIEDVDFQQGDTVQATFTVEGFSTVTCFQFSMKADTAVFDFLMIPDDNALLYDDAEEQEIISVNLKRHLLGGDTTRPAAQDRSAASPLTFTGAIPGYDAGDWSWHGKPGYNLQPGEMRTLWTNPYGKTVSDGATTHTVWLVAKQSGSLSQSFTLWANHPVLKPMHYKFPLIKGPLTVTYTAAQQTTATTEPSALDVRIFPNPVADALTVECDAPVQVEIFNAVGTLTHRSVAATREQFFGLNAGANLVRVTDGETVIVKTVFRL